jgi:hypothetical protein
MGAGRTTAAHGYFMHGSLVIKRTGPPSTLVVLTPSSSHPETCFAEDIRIYAVSRTHTWQNHKHQGRWTNADMGLQLQASKLKAQQ